MLPGKLQRRQVVVASKVNSIRSYECESVWRIVCRWNAEFLRQVCHKAGLPPEAYMVADAELFTFTAEVFHEGK